MFFLRLELRPMEQRTEPTLATVVTITDNTEVGREGPNNFKLDDHPSTTTQRTENISLLAALDRL